MFEKQEPTAESAAQLEEIKNRYANMTPEQQDRFLTVVESLLGLAQVDDLRRAVMKGER